MGLLHNRYTEKWIWKPLYTQEVKRAEAAQSISPKIFGATSLKTAIGSDTVLGIFTFERDIANACWTAYSILKGLPEIDLVFMLERDISDISTASVLRLFPNARFERYVSVLEKMRNITPALIENFAFTSPVGRKLLMVLSMQQQTNLLYSDADILCFNEISEIYQEVSNVRKNLHLQESGNSSSFEPKMQETIEQAGFSLAPRMNSGLMFIRKNSLDVAAANTFFRDANNFNKENWWVEQTVLAALMHAASSEALPAKKYLVSSQGMWLYEPEVQYDTVALRHFVSPIRHLLYTQGMPYLLQHLHLADGARPKEA